MSGSGICSWYGEEFQGNSTASGERFNFHDMTAAHKELPLGTRIRVTNVSNGKYVDVRINDRGPFTPGRVVDLTKDAFAKVEDVDKGLFECKYTTI